MKTFTTNYLHNEQIEDTLINLVVNRTYNNKNDIGFTISFDVKIKQDMFNFDIPARMEDGQYTLILGDDVRVSYNNTVNTHMISGDTVRNSDNDYMFNYITDKIIPFDIKDEEREIAKDQIAMFLEEFLEVEFNREQEESRRFQETKKAA
jgi:hypothetical protein